MAKQRGPIIWEKTIGFISFYKRCGVGCVRMKSNLTGERWRSDPAFEGSRISAACMALSAPLASPFYQSIPKQYRAYSHYKQLVGVAQHMLCAGYNIEQVNKVLHFTVARFLRKLQAAEPDRKPLRSSFAAMLSLKVRPAFKPAMPHPMNVFMDITLGVATVNNRERIIPPRGSPTLWAESPGKRKLHLQASAPLATYIKLPVSAISNGMALVCPYRRICGPILKITLKNAAERLIESGSLL